jgi:hypothetical protein
MRITHRILPLIALLIPTALCAQRDMRLSPPDTMTSVRPAIRRSDSGYHVAWIEPWANKPVILNTWNGRDTAARVGAFAPERLPSLAGGSLPVQSQTEESVITLGTLGRSILLTSLHGRSATIGITGHPGQWSWRSDGLIIVYLHRDGSWNEATRLEAMRNNLGGSPIRLAGLSHDPNRDEVVGLAYAWGWQGEGIIELTAFGLDTAGAESWRTTVPVAGQTGLRYAVPQAVVPIARGEYLAIYDSIAVHVRDTGIVGRIPLPSAQGSSSYHRLRGDRILRVSRAAGVNDATLEIIDLDGDLVHTSTVGDAIGAQVEVFERPDSSVIIVSETNGLHYLLVDAALRERSRGRISTTTAPVAPHATLLADDMLVSVWQETVDATPDIMANAADVPSQTSFVHRGIPSPHAGFSIERSTSCELVLAIEPSSKPRELGIGNTRGSRTLHSVPAHATRLVIDVSSYATGVYYAALLGDGRSLPFVVVR